MCTNPIGLHLQGYYKEDLYGSKKKGSYYDFPIFVGCTNCNQCANLKSNNWTIKNYYESKKHNKMCFITLTYNKENYTWIPLRKDIQLFIKRLRRYLDYHENKLKIRYFGVCEYGKRTGRIHYHLIIYGWEEKPENLLKLGKNKKGNDIYRSVVINKCWKYGIHSYQIFEKHEIPYIVMYNAIKKESKKYLLESREQLKKLENLIKSKNKAYFRNEVLKNIEDKRKELVKNKKNYIKLKEYNFWSTAIGFDKFYEEYKKDNNYIFKEYFDSRTIFTPTEWLKKLAIKYNDENAINELEKRTEYAVNKINLEVIKNTAVNILNEERRLKDDILSHNFENYDI